MKFTSNPRNFSIKNVIAEQVQREDEIAHAFDPKPALPVNQKIEKVEKDVPGWINFYKSTVETLRVLRP